MSNTIDLSDIMCRAKERYPFTPESYPGLGILSSSEDKVAFIASHSAHHMNATSGDISRQCERSDHGSVIDQKVLKEKTAKMFIHALVLAGALGMTPEDLFSETMRQLT